MLRNIKTIWSAKTITLACALLPLVIMAQDATKAAAPAATNTNSSDLLWYAIYGIMGLLLIVIMVLGNVFINVVRIAIQKNSVKSAAVILLMLVSAAAFAQGAPAPQPEPVNSMVTNWNMIMALCIIVTELFVIVVLLLRMRRLLNELVPQQQAVKQTYKVPGFLDSLNASVAVEKEKDILLDHNYDGIKELDNNLPPWWKYSFIISIFWAICYLSYYHLMGGPSSHDEYITAMRLAKEQQEAYARANAGKVDENTVTLADAAGIADGKEIFATNCSPCHGKLGEGVVGPNLTDDYWLHGGSIKDVFKTIKYGWPAKGMKSWSTDLSPVQIKDVASYIKSLHGTNPPNAKAPQGDLYAGDGAPAMKADSAGATVSADTSKAKSM